jgi:hypothetical protein
VRFQDAARDARAVVYAGIQADPLVARAADLLARATRAQMVMARAVMNGETVDADGWRIMFPTLFGDEVDAAVREGSESILDVSLRVADRGEQARSQYRGAIVEELTARVLARRVGEAAVHRERRILFDGIAAEIHPYDVTAEVDGAPEAYDCKWGARGINADVLHQLDAARTHAEGEEVPLLVALVVFDARRSCLVRLARQTAPRSGTRLVSLESIRALSRARPSTSAGIGGGGSG